MRDLNEETEEQEDDFSDEKMQEKVKGRKKRVVAGNRIIFIGFLAWTVASLFTSLKTMNCSNILSSIVATNPGPLLASGFAYIMMSACQADRLSSDTYKRLNLNLVLFGFLGLCNKNKNSLVWNLLCAITCINSIKGYGYGIKGWELRKQNSPFQDVYDGTISNIKSLFKTSNEQSVGYLLATIFAGMLAVLSIKKGNVSVEALSSLFLLATMTFTLKDAADRNRLQGTTFIELNFMSAAVFLQFSGKN